MHERLGNEPRLPARVRWLALVLQPSAQGV